MVQEPSTVTILDVPIARQGMAEAIHFCKEASERGFGGYFCFANVHTVVEARLSNRVRSAMTGARLAFADGVPLRWVAKLKGFPVTDRVSGPDFMHRFLKDYPTYPHVFVGGAPGVAESVARRYSVNAPCYSPPIRPFSEENVRNDLSMVAPGSDPATPRMIWVGLGAPKQELWMQCASALSPNDLFFGVGAAFDFLAGNKSRAPVWMQRTGLEWLFRLGQEPARLAKRYFFTNVQFIYYLLRDALK